MSGGWNTIESDAGVFTYLVENLGVKDVQFEEMVSLDSDSLRQLSPVYGVIFLFKYPVGQPLPEDPSQAVDGSFDPAATENIFFANQVIQNACATQAILSVLLNRPDIAIGNDLDEFREFTHAFPSDLRGEALSNSELIRTVHNTFSRSSPFVDESQRVATDADDVYHFIAYSSVQGTLYELDGLQPAPISHGACEDSSFADAIIPVLQRRIARYPANEIRFNLLAMVRDPRLRAREIGDVETLQREAARREAWTWENELRRHNFVGFVHELLKVVMRDKSEKDQVDEWIEEARAKGQQRIEERSQEGEGGAEAAEGYEMEF